MQHQSSLYKTAYIAYIPRGRRGLFYSPFGGKKINMEEKKKSTTASQLILLIQGARGGWIWDFPDKHLRDKRSCQLSVGHWAISSVMSMMTLKFHFPNPQIWNIVFYLPSGKVESFFFSSHKSTACCDSLNIYSDKPAFLSLPQSLQDAAQPISVTIKK